MHVLGQVYATFFFFFFLFRRAWAWIVIHQATTAALVCVKARRSRASHTRKGLSRRSRAFLNAICISTAAKLPRENTYTYNIRRVAWCFLPRRPCGRRRRWRQRVRLALFGKGFLKKNQLDDFSLLCAMHQGLRHFCGDGILLMVKWHTHAGAYLFLCLRS